jgi:WD40 repeat protein
VLIDALTGRQLRSLRKLSFLDLPLANLAFNFDGRLVASALGHEVQVWDVDSGEERARFAGLVNNFWRGTAFSPDGRQLAFAADNKSIEVWDIKDHKRLATHREPSAAVFAIAFSPDGQRVASVGFALNNQERGEVAVWEAATGREIWSLNTGDYKQLASVAFSPDGKRVLTAGWNQPVRIWDLANRREVQVLRGHSDVICVAFNPGGTRLVTMDLNGTTKLWTWPAGDEVLTLPVHKGGFVAFVAEGQKLATANDAGVTIWDASPRPASATLSE